MNFQKHLPKKYSDLSTAEVLETAKQRLMALATCLKRYTVGTRRINRMFSNNPSKVYSHLQGSEVAADPRKAEMEQYCKNILEKEMT